MDTATRLLELLTLLHARPTWTAADLAERLAVTERTVRRDVTRLRELGHPVEATRGRHGGYQLAPGETLPPLVLDDREALAVVLGLRMAAAGTAAGIEESAVDALAKLERVLPDRLREQVQDLQEATVMLSRSPVTSTPSRAPDRPGTRVSTRGPRPLRLYGSGRCAQLPTRRTAPSGLRVGTLVPRRFRR
jgi:predicted DNA-binding transcriptional regulator YafY